MAQKEDILKLVDKTLYTPELITRVQALLDKGAATGEYVSAWEEVQSILKDASLAFHKFEVPENVGISQWNRSKLLVGGAEAQHHGADVLQDGWSWNKCSDVASFDLPPSPYDAKDRKANEKVQYILY